MLILFQIKYLTNLLWKAHNNMIKCLFILVLSIKIFKLKYVVKRNQTSASVKLIGNSCVVGYN